MSNLWNPTKSDRIFLSSGNMKIRLHNLRANGLIQEGTCQYCGKEVYLGPSRDHVLNLTGSVHKCKGMR